MGIISYYFRSAKFEYQESNNSDTAIIFIHGILSETKNAFKLDDKKGYFWDELKKLPIFSSFDFAAFSYGRIDLSYILELDNPFNNLEKIANELNGYLRQYKKVIFIAHSQGGLLAKTYTSIFYKEQGIFLITLHTPHKNKSISVMRSKIEETWMENVRYVVPHIFCASINDNKIVKPDNAFYGYADRFFLSIDETKKHLGHSHLSSSPDTKLLKFIESNVYFFLNSGHSGSIPSTLSYFNCKEKIDHIKIISSRSLRKIREFLPLSKVTNLIAYPWKHQLFSDPHFSISEVYGFSSSNILIIYAHCCSANYFARCLINKANKQSITICSENLDKIGSNTQKLTNNYLCEKSIESKNIVSTTTNPYSEILFDAKDFNKKELMTDKEFLSILSKIMQNKGLTLKKILELDDKQEYKSILNAVYYEAVSYYREYITHNIYKNFPSKWNFGIELFRPMLNEIIVKITHLENNKNDYSAIYFIIKSITQKDPKQEFNIYDIEYLISRLLCSDGYSYWLDRNIRYAFFGNRRNRTNNESHLQRFYPKFRPVT